MRERRGERGGRGDRGPGSPPFPLPFLENGHVRGKPKALLVGQLPLDKLPPVVVDVFDDLQGVVPVLVLAIESKLVLRLAIRGLVILKPVPDHRKGPLALGKALEVRDSVEVLGAGVVGADANQLPVRLPLVQHRQHSQDFDLIKPSDGERKQAQLHNVNGVGISLQAGVLVGLVGVLKGLRHQPVVEGDPVSAHVVREVPKLSILDVLLNGVQLDLRGYLHLGLGVFRDLVDVRVDPLAGLHWNDMPRGDLLALLVHKEYAELRGIGFALNSGLECAQRAQASPKGTAPEPTGEHCWKREGERKKVSERREGAARLVQNSEGEGGRGG
eukprot:RCo030298